MRKNWPIKIRITQLTFDSHSPFPTICFDTQRWPLELSPISSGRRHTPHSPSHDLSLNPQPRSNTHANEHAEGSGLTLMKRGRQMAATASERAWNCGTVPSKNPLVSCN